MSSNSIPVPDWIRLKELFYHVQLRWMLDTWKYQVLIRIFAIIDRDSYFWHLGIQEQEKRVHSTTFGWNEWVSHKELFFRYHFFFFGKEYFCNHFDTFFDFGYIETIDWYFKLYVFVMKSQYIACLQSSGTSQTKYIILRLCYGFFYSMINYLNTDMSCK